MQTDASENPKPIFFRIRRNLKFRLGVEKSNTKTKTHLACSQYNITKQMAAVRQKKKVNALCHFYDLIFFFKPKNDCLENIYWKIYNKQFQII